MVAHCIEIGKPIEELTMEQLKAISPVFQDDVYEEVSVKTCVEGRKAYGGPAKQAVETQIQLISDFLQQQAEM